MEQQPGRIEWTELTGEDIEAVVAMFVNRKSPRSVRITPSRGDGGVDILDRGAGPGGGDVVYQVKRYSRPLTRTQKTEVERSLERLREDPRWTDLDVVEWRLVMPWNPTPEAETWFRTLVEGSTMKAVWWGKDALNNLASEYPEVADYYLHGGRTRVEETYLKVMGVFSVGHGAATPGSAAEQSSAGSGVPVLDVMSRIKPALRLLQRSDPHYTYELSTGQFPMPNEPPNRPGLVQYQVRGDQAENEWFAIALIARCEASTIERPINVKGSFTVEPGSDFEKQLRDFFTYGAPFTSPAGAFNGSMEAPGGLGGPLKETTISVGPVADQDLGEDQQQHLEALDPDGATVLASVDVVRSERSIGVSGQGARAVFTDVDDMFELEHRFDLRNVTTTRSVRLLGFKGRPVARARKVAEFLSALCEPNLLRASSRGTPSQLGHVSSQTGVRWPDEIARYFDVAVRAFSDLEEIQRHTSVPLGAPELSQTTTEELYTWYVAAQLLRGIEVNEAYPEGHCLQMDLMSAATVVPGEDLYVILPFSITVNGREVDLGQKVVFLPEAEVVDQQPTEYGSVWHSILTKDRKLRHWRYTAEENGEQSSPN